MIRSILLSLAGLFLSGCGRAYEMGPANMAPTIKTNEIIYLDRDTYRRNAPRRWDVIAFTTPTNSGLHVFRIWGLPGETIAFDGGNLQINGTNALLPAQLQPIINVQDIIAPVSAPIVPFPYNITSNGYFVLGDNLRNSFDSRYRGEISSNWIVGRVKGK